MAGCIVEGIVLIGEMFRTDRFGIILGSFGYTDSIRITMSDTAIGLHQDYSVKINPGVNCYALVWDP